MSSTRTSTAQEDPPGPPQAAQSTPAADAAPAPPPAATTAAPSAWSQQSEAERKVVATAMAAYLRSAHILDDSTPGVKVRVLFTETSTPWTAALTVRTSARKGFSTTTSVPQNTIRHLVPAQAAALANSAKWTAFHSIRDSLYTHYSGTSARLPMLADVPLAENSPLLPLLSPVSGISVVRTLNGIGAKAPAYVVDVGFSSNEAYTKAIQNEFKHHGAAVAREYAPPSSLAALVELRFSLPDNNAPDSELVRTLTNLLPASLELVQIHRYFNTTAGGALVGTANIAAYVRHAHLEPHQLAEILPNNIKIINVTVPVRHNHERGFCFRCRFAGHTAVDCPTSPCSSCSLRGHTSSACSNPTRKTRHNTSVATSTPAKTTAPAKPTAPSATWQKMSPGRSAAAPTLSTANATPIRLGTRFAPLAATEAPSKDLSRAMPALPSQPLTVKATAGATAAPQTPRKAPALGEKRSRDELTPSTNGPPSEAASSPLPKPSPAKKTTRTPIVAQLPMAPAGDVFGPEEGVPSDEEGDEPSTEEDDDDGAAGDASSLEVAAQLTGVLGATQTPPPPSC